MQIASLVSSFPMHLHSKITDHRGFLSQSGSISDQTSRQNEVKFNNLRNIFIIFTFFRDVIVFTLMLLVLPIISAQESTNLTGTLFENLTRIDPEKYFRNFLSKSNNGESSVEDGSHKIIRNCSEFTAAMCKFHNQINDTDASFDRRDKKISMEMRKLNMKLIKIEEKLNDFEKMFGELVRMEMRLAREELAKAIKGAMDRKRFLQN